MGDLAIIIVTWNVRALVLDALRTGFPELATAVWDSAIDLVPRPGRLYESRLNGLYSRALYATGEPFSVDQPLGATFMIRREVIEQIGLLDEQFFMYCEEVDWSMRIRQSGWEIYM